MKIIFASASFAATYNLLDTAGNFLEAYPKLTRNSPLIKWMLANPDSARVSLCDSGVFSTWSRGDVVDPDKYIAFVKDMSKDNIFFAYVGLDCIPGEFGRVPSPEEVEESAKKGWSNFEYLIDHGLNPANTVHVFHMGERFYWLEKLVAYHEKLVKSGIKDGLYIGISPANDRSTVQKRMWLDECMKYVTNSDGSAKLRWHGFGVTSFDLLRRFPWFSCDSSSWLRPGATGQIHLPKEGKLYIDSKLIVSVTARTGISKAANHLNSFSKDGKDYVVEYIKSHGFTLEQCQDKEGVRAGTIARQTINLRYWKQVEKELNTFDRRWKRLQESFL